jgi:hypothetical protein
MHDGPWQADLGPEQQRHLRHDKVLGVRSPFPPGGGGGSSGYIGDKGDGDDEDSDQNEESEEEVAAAVGVWSQTLDSRPFSASDQKKTA